MSGYVAFSVHLQCPQLIVRGHVKARLQTVYTTDLLKGVETFWACPRVLRPYFGPFLPRFRALKRSVKALERLLEPIWSDHLNSTSDLAPDLVPKDFVQWHLDRSDDRGKRDLEYQALCNILLTSAGTDALGMTVSSRPSSVSQIWMKTEVDQTFQTLCDLAARPEYLPPLREEAEAFFARVKEEGSLTAKSMTTTPKLDSFIKESLRLNPLELNMCSTQL